VARGSQDRPTFAAPAANASTASASTEATGSTAAASAPDTAGIANAFAAAIPTPKADSKQQVFHGLFVDGGGRAAPLAPVVSALWGTPNAAPSAGGTTAKPFANGMLDLFKDPSETG